MLEPFPSFHIQYPTKKMWFWFLVSSLHALLSPCRCCILQTCYLLHTRWRISKQLTCCRLIHKVLYTCENSVDTRFTPRAGTRHTQSWEKGKRDCAVASMCACVLENCNSYNLCCMKLAYVRLTCQSPVMAEHVKTGRSIGASLVHIVT